MLQVYNSHPIIALQYPPYGFPTPTQLESTYYYTFPAGFIMLNFEEFNFIC